MNEDLDKLLEKATEALRRDLNHIFLEVSGSKLPPTSARDLVAYVKLLGELKKSEKDAANELSRTPESELREVARQLLEESNK